MPPSTRIHFLKTVRTHEYGHVVSMPHFTLFVVHSHATATTTTNVPRGGLLPATGLGLEQLCLLVWGVESGLCSGSGFDLDFGFEYDLVCFLEK